MRLGVKLLNVGASLNQHKQVTDIAISPGENLDLVFQFIDLDQGIRYIPDAGATVQVLIPRSPAVSAGVLMNSRVTSDPSIARPAAMAFAGRDPSIWYMPLSSDDTKAMVSNAIQVTLTEGSNTKIAWLNRCIRIIKGQDS